MFYSTIKRETLSHINQYTMASATIPLSYNNQADYVNRIPMLINEALVNILTLVKKDPVVFPLNGAAGEEYGHFARYELPGDFYALKTGGVSVIKGDRFYKTNNYKVQGKKYILVPKDEADNYTVEYYRYPNLLPADPADSFDLDEDIEVIQAATYYAAASLVRQEDEFAYATLYNDYESRLSRISPGVSAEADTVQDVYHFGAGGWQQ